MHNASCKIFNTELHLAFHNLHFLTSSLCVLCVLCGKNLLLDQRGFIARLSTQGERVELGFLA
jgi:hypothetical protein